MLERHATRPDRPQRHKNYNIPFFLLSMSRAGRAVTFEMESYQNLDGLKQLLYASARGKCYNFRSGWLDSNQRPHVPKTRILTNCTTSRYKIVLYYSVPIHFLTDYPQLYSLRITSINIKQLSGWRDSNSHNLILLPKQAGHLLPATPSYCKTFPNSLNWYFL